MLIVAKSEQKIDKKGVRLKILELVANIWIMNRVLDKALDYRDVKKRAGRKKDMEDVKELEKIKKK